MTRRETLVEMLRRFHEAREPLDTIGDGRGGGRTTVPLMPPAWNKSFRELERCLVVMRETRPKQYWHVRGRYLGPPSKRQIELVYSAGRYHGLTPFQAVPTGFAGPYDPIWDERTRDKSRKRGNPTGWCIVETWDPKVRRQVVRDAVEWIDDEFRGSPFLPDEMLKAA